MAGEGLTPFNPTPYADVNRLLRVMSESVQHILGDQLVGFYLYGSLSLGDFDPQSSDVDFLVVTEGEISAARFEALRMMHEQIAVSDLPFATHLEGSYIPREAIRHYDADQSMHPTIGVDWDFQIGRHGSNWIVERHIIREHGIVVYGVSPKPLIDPVDPHDLRGAVCEMLTGFWQAQLSGPDWLRPRDYQAFAVLTMCRALYTITMNDVVSKPTAAVWAMQTLDAKWRSLIEKALIWRHEHEIDDLGETLAFMRFAIARGLEICEGE